ncbi:metallophosphatase [Tsukamurella sputi]|uniref:Metallophosphatase n=1 Tax=Tsukamurella sputi TaxID=2591848 RepID=A0A5C5RLV9_9ACTN|nr:metallophosphoesterase [Tsukamurella sputi]TWS23181.1 metallophosphatase [Tsukamurella sputi]
MRYYTADLHLGHQLVADTRQYDNTDVHDSAILSKLHALNPKGDQLYILGDLSGGSKRATERALDLLAEVPVTKHLILGNHDPAHPMHRDAWKWQRRYLDVFESVQPYARQRFTVDGQRHEVLLSHFPYGGDHTDTERYSQYRLPDEGRWLLHGHTHSGKRTSTPPGGQSYGAWWDGRENYQLHVGWDAWRRPVSEDDIAALIREGTPNTPDLQAELAESLRRHRGLRGHPAIPIPTTVPEQTAARFTGPTITPEEN